MVSLRPRRPALTTATLNDTLGGSVTLEARAPQLMATAPIRAEFLDYLIYGLGILALLVVGYWFGKRRQA